MADMKTSMDELKKMNSKDRAKHLAELEKERAKLRPLLATGKEKQNHKMTALRKQIARIQTLNNSEKHAQ